MEEREKLGPHPKKTFYKIKKIPESEQNRSDDVICGWSQVKHDNSPGQSMAAPKFKVWAFPAEIWVLQSVSKVWLKWK